MRLDRGAGFISKAEQPVSYTHLDVYKRQDTIWKRSGSS